MTTKPKARKAPAKAARKTRAKPAPSINKIEGLIARWKWCEADQDYRTALAPRDRDADRCHEAEQGGIIAELRTLAPKDYFELAARFRFAIDEIKMGPRCDGAESDMLLHVYDAVPSVLRDERESSRLEGMKNMREFLNRRTGTSYALASDPEIIGKIGRGII
jgi:hypothetical protein